MKLHEFGNNVAKMLTKMQTIYNTLKLNGHTPDSFRRYVYLALKTGPNDDFNLFMDRIIDDIQSGIGFNKDITADELIIAACTKYNNMVEDKTWGKVNPLDAKVLALTTKLEKLEKEGAVKTNAAANATDEKHHVEERRSIIRWRNGVRSLTGIQRRLTAALIGGASTTRPRTMMVSMSPCTHLSTTTPGPRTRRIAQASIAQPLQSILILLEQRVDLLNRHLVSMIFSATFS